MGRMYRTTRTENIKFYRFIPVAITIFMVLLSPKLMAANINYPADGTPLDNDPIYNVADSLFPGTSLSNNTVSVTDNGPATSIPGYVYGGGADSAEEVFDNTVTINITGTTGNLIYGGASTNGNVHGNQVTVLGGTIGIQNTPVDVYVAGGFSRNGNVYGNKTYIGDSGGASPIINGFADGGRSDSGSVYNNELYIYNGNIWAGAYGGYSGPEGTTSTGEVYNNKAFVYGGQIGSSVAGGRNDDQGNVHDNQLTISGGDVDGSNGTVYGGRGNTGTVSNNTVTIDGGTFTNARVFGGMASYDSSDFTQGGGIARDNKVFITADVDVGDLYGGLSGGDSDVTGNSVDISGEVGDVTIVGGSTNAANATGNSVNISGTVGDAVIYGGLTDGGQATGNSVTIRQNATVGTSASLLGGYDAGSGPDFFTGNKLVVEGRAPMTLNQVNYFEHYDLTLPAGFASADTLITVSSATYLDNYNNPGQLAQFTLHVSGDDPLKNPGDYFTVISQTDMFSGGRYQSTATGLHGFGLQYTYDLDNQDPTYSGVNNALIATIRAVNANPSTQPLVQGGIATSTFLVQGADFVINQGLDAAIGARLFGRDPDDCGNDDCGNGWSPRVFAVAGYGSTRQKANGHVDVDGTNLMTGVSFGNDSCTRPLNFALFLDGGIGRYNSRGHALGSANVKGRGDVKYIGGGLMGRAERLAGNLYLEGSFRFGWAKSDYRARNLVYMGQPLPKFDLRGNYVGAHAGLGYVFDFSDSVQLDTAVKYLWTRLDGDSVTLLGDRYRFDSIDSHRVQAGGRLAWGAGDNRFSPFVGAWYEHEFDGKAGGTVQGFKIRDTKTRGSTGIFEAGVTFHPGKKGPMFEAGLNGSLGKRQHIGGHVAFGWNF